MVLAWNGQVVGRAARWARLALLPSLLILAGAPAFAGEDTARVDRLEKQVKELRAIVFQARDTGKPVEVRPEGPDPALAALSQRVDDLEAVVRKIQGSSEITGHDIDLNRAGLETERTDRATAIQSLTDRLAKLESQLASATAPPPPPPPSTPVQDASAEFKSARALLANGDYAGATGAFQAFLDAHPADPKAAEAYYWLGDSYQIRDLNGDATAAFARALKGWPKSPWAPDAVVKLAKSLGATQKAPEACAALTEFSHRYGATAPSAIRARATQLKAKLGCGG